MSNPRNDSCAFARFRFPAALLALAWLCPHFGSAATRATDYVQTEVAITGSQTLNISFPDGFYVSGSARDASNQPLAGAIVTAAGADGVISAWGLTDSTGAYQIAVRSGTYDIIVSPPLKRVINPSTLPRLVPVAAKNVAVVADTAGPAIALQNGFILSGTFQPPSGTMTDLAGNMRAFPVKGDWFTGSPAAIGDGVYATQYAIALPKGKYTLLFAGGQAFDSNWKMLPASSFAVTAVSLTRDSVANIKLAKGYSLTGIAKDAGGIPLHGIIYLRPKGADPTKDRRSTIISVVNGKFITNLPAGAYEGVFYPGMPSSYTGKATRTKVELTMPAAAKTLSVMAVDGVVLSGKTRGAGEAASAGAMLWLTPSGADPKSLDGLPLIGSSAKNGAYRVSVPPGNYDLHAWPGISGAEALMPGEMGRWNFARR